MRSTTTLVDEVAILGTADECRERVRELAAGGITTHIIACPSEDPADQRRTYDAFRPAAFRFQSGDSTNIRREGVKTPR